MRVLITGITGMVGSHLADYILENHPDVEVHGLARWRSPLDNVRQLKGKVKFWLGDLCDLASMHTLFENSDYDYVFHLAAQSYVPYSLSVPVQTLETNIIGTLNLLEAIFKNGRSPAIHLCCSSEEYGQVDEDNIPIKEDCPLRPVSPYGVSKVAQDMLGFQYYVSHRMSIIRTRAFSHTGPRRGSVFAASAFARQIALIEARKCDNPISVGNLDSIRTWADVRDIVRAYWLLLEKCEYGEVYNIGGDRTATVGEVLEILKDLARCKIEHVVDTYLLRHADVTLQIPDITKFREATGWEPEIPLEETLHELLDYWRVKIQRI